MNITEHLILTPFLILGNGTKIDMTKEFGRYGYRTMWQIVQSCVLTIIACTWVTIRPNISPRRYWLARSYYKLQLWIVDLVMPELLLLWAAKQYLAARWLANWEAGNDTERTATSNLQKDKLSGSPSESARIQDDQKTLFPEDETIQRSHSPENEATPYSDRKKGKSWTTTQALFALMGGCEDKAGVTLSPYVNRRRIDMPRNEEIMDKSKRDTFLIFLSLSQTLWFTFVTIFRIQSRVLFATEAEVATLTFAVLSVITNFFWWYKPQGVDLPLPHYPNPTSPEDHKESNAPPPNRLQLAISSLQSEDFPPIFFKLAISMLRSGGFEGNNEDGTIAKSRVYGYNGQLSWKEMAVALFCASCCGSLYSVVHLVIASLNGGLTLTNGRIWFYLALVGSAFPFCLLMVVLFACLDGWWNPDKVEDHLRVALTYAQVVLIVSGIGRVLLIGALAHFMFYPFNEGTYLTPKWSQYIPHL